MGTLLISGSEEISLRKRTIAFSLSISPSSRLISIICAPFSTCSLATDNASSNLSSLISLLKRREPVTFVLSPTLIKLDSGRITSGSSPLNFVNESTLETGRGFLPSTMLDKALM